MLVDTLISFIGEFSSYLDDVRKIYRMAYIYICVCVEILIYIYF